MCRGGLLVNVFAREKVNKSMDLNYKNTVLHAGNSILEAIKIIDQAALQIVLVVDDQDRLIGTITDGDIRRSILEGRSLESAIENIMNKNPRVLHEDATQKEMLDFMTKHKIYQLPILNKNGNVVSLVQLDDLVAKDIALKKPQDDVWVVLMLGGMGTRLMPLTEHMPKPMIDVGGKPLLETIVSHLSSQGFKNFYFSVNYKADLIKKHFGDGKAFGINIVYLDEEKRLGTAGALSLIPERPTGSLIIMNGDILTNNNFRHLVNFHQQTQAIATMCVREYQQQVPYGVVQTKGTKFDTIVEKPSQTYFVNAGIYVLDPQVLDYVSVGEYLDMPDLFRKLEEEGKESTVFPIREYWRDIGNLDDLEQGRAEYENFFKTG